MDLLAGDLYGAPGPVRPLHFQGNSGPFLPLDGGEHGLPVVGCDGLTIHPTDNLPCLEARLLGRAALRHPEDFQPVLHILAYGDANAHVGVFPVGLDLLRLLRGEVVGPPVP